MPWAPVGDNRFPAERNHVGIDACHSPTFAGPIGVGLHLYQVQGLQGLQGKAFSQVHLPPPLQDLSEWACIYIKYKNYEEYKERHSVKYTFPYLCRTYRSGPAFISSTSRSCASWRLPTTKWCSPKNGWICARL